jgi:hypothetical protein
VILFLFYYPFISMNVNESTDIPQIDVTSETRWKKVPNVFRKKRDGLLDPSCVVLEFLNHEMLPLQFSLYLPARE